MNVRPLFTMIAILAGSACAKAAPAPPLSPAKALPPTAPATVGATAPQPALGSIVGTIATNPWRAMKGGGVVYLEDGPQDTGVPLSATLDNHDMAFVPSIAVVAAGGSVIFTNTDPVTHNVFSPDGEKWDLGQIPQRGSVVKRFERPGVYSVLCNMHPGMLAYLVVSPSSHFARAAEDGSFVIKDVPPGTYHVTAWVPRLKPVTQAVTLGGAETDVRFALER